MDGGTPTWARGKRGDCKAANITRDSSKLNEGQNTRLEDVPPHASERGRSSGIAEIKV